MLRLDVSATALPSRSMTLGGWSNGRFLRAGVGRNVLIGRDGRPEERFRPVSQGRSPPRAPRIIRVQ